LKTQTISQTEIKGNRWLSGLFGVEKENIRVDLNGVIAQTPHPAVFGDKLKHPYITTDFSESQVEMITPPLPSISETLGFLETIHDLVSLELKNEYLWPQSVPPVLPAEEQIPIAQYAIEGKKDEEYREGLARKYGRKKLTLSGIHFNLSIDENLLFQLHREMAPSASLDEFKDSIYLKITRQLLRYRWLYVLLFGNSPVVDPSFDLKCRNLPVKLQTQLCALSVRNSCFGYGNIDELFPNYQSVIGYQQSIEGMVKGGKISANKELYASVRPKFLKGPESISYVEVRFIDINPMSKIGVTPEMLQFIHWLAIYGLFIVEKDDFSPAYQTIANQNVENVSLDGLNDSVTVISNEGVPTNAWTEALHIITEMTDLYNRIQIEDEGYRNMLRYIHSIAIHSEKREVDHLIAGIEEEGFIEFHLGKAQHYLEESQKNSFNFYGLEDMELSTQLVLREAVRRGVKFEILDRQGNFVRLSRQGNIQYVCQATKTSLDNYASILAMENKLVTKKILEENGIRVPKGMDYSNSLTAKSDFNLYKGNAVVIKPKSTNFGEGITILKENNEADVYNRAVDIAFEADNSILIEEFIAGKEFRVFVMNNEVVGILHRVPANVTGNGKQTIRDLVIEKNKDPLRGKGYHTPLEKINLGEAELIFLNTQGKDFDTIPIENETVFLRENSNISTGGDSIDFTDDIPESYKKIAVKAAQALDVKITGLDMIIDDYNKEATFDNYAIIELNFNPAIHIHCHPYKGKNRRLNEKLLDILGFTVFSASEANL
jgi:glutamate--cysteine ligase